MSHIIYDIIGMSNATHQQLLAERSALLAELACLPHVVHGSIVERYTVCSRANCKCHQGQKHGPVMCVVVNENGKQRQKYIPKEMRELAVQYVDEYKRALTLLDRISAINVQLLQEKNNG